MNAVVNVIAAIPLPAISVALGSACVAALYVLHHLRIQPQRRAMATLLFWQQALRSQQARALWTRRFSHRRTFVFLAVILALLAATLTADRWGATQLTRDIIVIDAGVDTAIADGGNGTFLRKLAASAAADLPELDCPGVVIAGARPLLIVRPDQPSVLAARALGDLMPQPGASASPLALELANAVLGDLPGRIHWYTSHDALPEGLLDSIARRVVLHTIQPPNSVAITGIAFEAAADGAPTGTLRVELSGTVAGAIRVEARVENRDAVVQSAQMRRTSAGIARGQLSFADSPADGRSVTLHLDGAPGAAPMQSATYALPDLRPLAFRFAGGVPEPLRLALLAIGVEANEPPAANRKAIFVAPAETPVPIDATAAILIVRNGAQISAGAPLHLADTALASGLTLEGALTADGPALADGGAPLLLAGSATLATLDVSADRPTLRLSEAAVGNSASLPRRAAFPVLMRRLCDALSHRADAPATISLSRAAIDPLWAGPPESRPMETIPLADAPAIEGVVVPASPENRRWHIRWSEVLLAGALGMLVVESLLLAKRKIV